MFELHSYPHTRALLGLIFNNIDSTQTLMPIPDFGVSKGPSPTIGKQQPCLKKEANNNFNF